ncbi:MAG TPA: FecR domain-containing protein [Stellaceae bacterium]|nr:FecR domain-containing protein [Stellaceae bacterium]
MHVRSAIALLGLCALCLLSRSAAADGRAGVVGSVAPHVQAAMPDGSTHELKAGEDVVSNENIVSDASGSAEILFVDGSSLRIGPDTETTIDGFAFAQETGDGKLETRTTKGLIRFVGGKLSKKGNVTMRTPVAVLSVRGGIALASVAADGGATEATFLYGDALTVTSRTGATLIITEPGYFTDVSTLGALTPAQRAEVGALVAKIAALRGTGAATAAGGTADDTLAALFASSLTAEEIRAALAAIGTDSAIRTALATASRLSSEPLIERSRVCVVTTQGGTPVCH